MKKTVIFIAPHLSTGGMPQYLYKQIESVYQHMNVYCIEWANVTGGKLVIQRNRIEKLLGNNLITLSDNKDELFIHIQRIKPDIIHLQEIPEFFMPNTIADNLYTPQRDYVLVETSHDSSFNIQNKIYLPDKFLMVSQYQVNDYKLLGVPCEMVEYPIEKKTRTKTREQALRDLGLDPNLKHVINVGLFTPRKNQAEIIEYARMLQKYPIQFHFLGNQADNFKFYWEPLMKDFPPNCKWWNERDDVDKFYEAADLFLFTSRGTNADKETMPLVIRESISWDTPSLIYNLPVYLDYFNKFENIKYLDFNSLPANADKIVNQLNLTSPKYNLGKSCAVVSAYPNTQSSVKITKDCITRLKQMGLTTILAVHCDIPDDLRNAADHVVLDINNILTTNSYYTKFWYTNDNPKFRVEANIDKEKNNIYHGPAVYTNYYNGISLAHRLGFENVHCVNFDVLFNDNVPIMESEQALTHSNAWGCLIHDQEGHTMKTFYTAIKAKFFLENFPIITNEAEYTEWVRTVGAESNGLENVWYHTVKNKLNQITTVDQSTFYNTFKNNTIDLCSQAEYTTILPLYGNDNILVVWCSINNLVDERQLKIWENDTLLETLDVKQKFNYYKMVPRTKYQKFKFEFIDSVRNVTVSTKEIIVDETYNLMQNGMFTYENS